MAEEKDSTGLRIYLSLVLQGAILFVSAGSINVPRAWLYIGICMSYYLASIIIMHKLNPEIIKIRSQKVLKKGTKSWDKLILACIMASFLAMLVLAGLDVGRFKWSGLGIHFAVLGFIFYNIATFVGIWAMSVNPHFEVTVRIQKERGHRVITTGPYRYVRHPGYVSGIFGMVAIPLIIGSVYGLIPAGVMILLLIVRTSLEDRTLRNELEGYTEYAQRVRYRLFPGVW
jgi:protein-S-isoprenylcysteine O-methyltransferase Ste14